MQPYRRLGFWESAFSEMKILGRMALDVARVVVTGHGAGSGVVWCVFIISVSLSFWVLHPSPPIAYSHFADLSWPNPLLKFLDVAIIILDVAGKS